MREKEKILGVGVYCRCCVSVGDGKGYRPTGYVCWCLETVCRSVA